MGYQRRVHGDWRCCSSTVNIMWILFVVVGVFAVTQSAAGREIGGFEDVEITSCPESFGLQLYPHPKNCDQFYKCANGTLTLETCSNGLLFDGKGSVHEYCNYYWATDCGERVYELEPEPGRFSSPYCEYSFGLFRASSACELFFYRCAFGEAEEVACEKGLAYDDRTHSATGPISSSMTAVNPKKWLDSSAQTSPVSRPTRYPASSHLSPVTHCPDQTLAAVW